MLKGVEPARPEEPAAGGGVEELDAAIATFPAQPEEAAARSELARLLSERGCLRWRQGALEPALADLGRAVELDPAAALARNNLGCARAEQGDVAGAIEELAAALRLDPRLATAAGNLRLLSGLVEEGEGARPRATTISASLRADGADFCEGLIDFLQANVPVAHGFEDCRDDAISDVVTRVLTTAEEADLSLTEALRLLRKSSTRGWVHRLVTLYRRRGGSEELSEALPARSAPPPPSAERAGAFAARLEEVLERRLEEWLASSRPSVRARRRVVWNVFVGSLKGGVRLSRKEVLASLRAMGVSKRKASDAMILGDLDRISRQLRETREL